MEQKAIFDLKVHTLDLFYLLWNRVRVVDSHHAEDSHEVRVVSVSRTNLLSQLRIDDNL